MNPNDFTLVDLSSQGRDVMKFVYEWSQDQILAWMCHYGRVTKIEGKGRFVFESVSNCYTTFRFSENDELIIFNLRKRDHVDNVG